MSGVENESDNYDKSIHIHLILTRQIPDTGIFRFFVKGLVAICTNQKRSSAMSTLFVRATTHLKLLSPILQALKTPKMLRHHVFMVLFYAVCPLFATDVPETMPQEQDPAMNWIHQQRSGKLQNFAVEGLGECSVMGLYLRAAPRISFPELPLDAGSVLKGTHSHYNPSLDEFELDEQERVVRDRTDVETCRNSGVDGCKQEILELATHLSPTFHDLVKTRVTTSHGLEVLEDLYKQTINFERIYSRLQTNWRPKDIKTAYQKKHITCEAEQCFHDVYCEAAHHFELIDLDEAVACIKEGALFDNRNLSQRHLLLGNALGDELIERAKTMLEAAHVGGVTFAEEEAQIGKLLSTILEGAKALEARTLIRNHLIKLYESNEDEQAELHAFKRHVLSKILSEHLGHHIYSILDYSVDDLYWAMKPGDEHAFGASIEGHQMMAMVRRNEDIQMEGEEYHLRSYRVTIVNSGSGLEVYHPRHEDLFIPTLTFPVVRWAHLMESEFYFTNKLEQIYHATRSDGPHASSPSPNEVYVKSQASGTCVMSSFFYYILYYETDVEFEIRERLVRQIKLSFISEAIQVPFALGEYAEEDQRTAFLRPFAWTPQETPLSRVLHALNTVAIYEHLDMIQDHIHKGQLVYGLELLGDLDNWIRESRQNPEEWQRIWSTIKYRYFEVREWIREHTQILTEEGSEEWVIKRVETTRPPTKPFPFAGDIVEPVAPPIRRDEQDAINALKDLQSKEPMEAWKLLMNAVVLGAHQPDLIKGLEDCKEVLSMLASDKPSAAFEIMLAAAQSQSIPLVHYLTVTLGLPLIIEEVKPREASEERQPDFYYKLNSFEEVIELAKEDAFIYGQPIEVFSALYKPSSKLERVHTEEGTKLREIWTQVFKELQHASKAMRVRFFSKQFSQLAVDLQQLRWLFRNICTSSEIGVQQKPCTNFFGIHGQYILQETCNSCSSLEKMQVFARNEGIFDYTPIYTPIEGQVDNPQGPLLDDESLVQRAASLFKKHGGLFKMLVNHADFQKTKQGMYLMKPVDWSVLHSIFEDPRSKLFTDDGETVSVIATVINTPSLRANADFLTWFFDFEHVKAIVKRHFNSIIYRVNMNDILLEQEVMTPEATIQVLRVLKPEPGIHFNAFVDNIIVPLSHHIASFYRQWI